MFALYTFCLALAWKVVPLFTFLGPLQKGVIQPPNDCWLYHDATDPIIVLITNFSLISKFSVSLKQAQPPLYCVRLPTQGGPFPNPKPGGTMHPGSVQKNGYKTRITRKPPVLLASMAVPF